MYKKELRTRWLTVSLQRFSFNTNASSFISCDRVYFDLSNIPANLRRDLSLQVSDVHG
jgi:hypothetical protein